MFIYAKCHRIYLNIQEGGGDMAGDSQTNGELVCHDFCHSTATAIGIMNAHTPTTPTPNLNVTGIWIQMRAFKGNLQTQLLLPTRFKRKML